MDNFRYDRHFADKKNIIASIAGIIHKGKGNINIAKIAEEVGYNQRYLDRVFKEAVGVSMKKYAGNNKNTEGNILFAEQSYL